MKLKLGMMIEPLPVGRQVVEITEKNPSNLCKSAVTILYVASLAFLIAQEEDLNHAVLQIFCLTQ